MAISWPFDDGLGIRYAPARKNDWVNGWAGRLAWTWSNVKHDTLVDTCPKHSSSRLMKNIPINKLCKATSDEDFV